jgi:hypothetical protein
VKRAPSILALALGVALAGPARAHHGVAAVGIGGPEGPGAALETTSPLPLPARTLFTMVKSEYVPFQKFGFADPTNKDHALFDTVAVGYGVRPWLSAYVFQPINLKAQDGTGMNAAPGDTSVMLSCAFKYDDGLQLVPEKESLDDLMDWHFSTWAATTIPLGPTERMDRHGAPFAPDMQIGFGSPSTTLGVAAMKQVSADLTWLTDASYQYFFPHTYSFTRYQFGGETRLGSAAVYRAFGQGQLRVDVAAELNGLYLQRDRERNGAGAMEAVAASGGAVLYGGLGLRVYYGRLAVALGIRRAVLRSLDEEAAQQGSEGLEKFRATFALSASAPL